MAQKRMFDKSITNSDDFLDLPDSSQVLYFHLSMNADDDGFINNWKSIVRMTGTKEDDLKILIAKQFVIPFESGVIVIKHWRLNNFLRKDRHIPTKHVQEMASLTLGNNEEYLLGQPLVNQRLTQNSIDKNSIDKNNILYNNIVQVVDEKKSNEKLYENEFENVWQLFPNKKGKVNALKDFIKARKKGVELETIIDGIQRYIEYIKNERIEQKYIKNGSTWFHQECWNDEYTISNNNARTNNQMEILKGVYDGKIKID